MTRLSRRALAVAVLLGSAACTTPTAPPVPQKAPPAKPLLECIAGWDVQAGTPC